MLKNSPHYAGKKSQSYNLSHLHLIQFVHIFHTKHSNNKLYKKDLRLVLKVDGVSASRTKTCAGTRAAW